MILRQFMHFGFVPGVNDGHTLPVCIQLSLELLQPSLQRRAIHFLLVIRRCTISSIY